MRSLRRRPTPLILALVACAPPGPTTPVAEPVSVAASLPTAGVLLHEDGVENAYPRLSRDGQRIVYQSNRSGKWQIWLMDLEGGAQRRLTDDAFNDNFVDWSADGQWIAFVSDRDGDEEIYRMRLDGGEPERLTRDPARDIHPYFAPDGASLLFNSTRGNGTLDLYALRLADGAIERLTDTLEEDSCGRYSPDMRQIVFLRNDATMDDVMLMDATTRRVTNLTRTPRVIDGWPVFSPDGAWIYYSTAETGAHSIHRIRPDGRGDQILTRAAAGEEDARASISGDGRRMIFNKRRAGGIDILALDLPAGR